MWYATSFFVPAKDMGEAGTVKTTTGKVSKVLDIGFQCMLVGYVLDHDRDIYRMWNPNTNRVPINRDVIWLRSMYFEPSVIPAIEVQPVIDTNIDIYIYTMDMA